MEPASYDEVPFIHQDMLRWWRGRAKTHRHNGELLIEVGAPKRVNLYEGVKRLASFGIKARVVRRHLRSW